MLALKMTAFGSIPEFRESYEPWSQYIERLEQFFVANRIEDADRRRAIFLTVIGSTTYGLVRNLLSPVLPTNQTLEQLVELLSTHFEPAPSEIVERFKFNSRVRNPGESVASFIAELRRLAKHCNFGSTLDVMLRDRIVCGIQDDGMQKKLLSEVGLTLARATEISVAMEAAVKHNQDLTSNLPFEVRAVKQSFSQSKQKSDSAKTKTGTVKKGNCYRCGSGSHVSSKCRFVQTKCYSCGKIGHLAKVCFSTKKINQESFPRSTEHSKKVNRVEVQQTPAEGLIPDHVFVLTKSHETLHVKSTSKAPPPVMLKFEVQGKEMSMEMDSGAPFTIVPVKTYHRLKDSLPELEKSDICLQSYTGHQIQIAGVVNVMVTYKGSQQQQLPLLVVNQGTVNLAGRNWLEAFSLLPRQGDSEVHSVMSTKCSDELLMNFSQVFSAGLGVIQGVKVHLTLRPNAVPAFYKARSVPYALRTKVDKELDRLIQERVLEPVQSSEWAAPVVPVLKPDGNVRLCGDFKLTVNPATVLEQYPLPNIEDLFSQLTGGETFSKIDLRDAYCQLQLDDESKKLVVINTHRGLFQYTRLPFGVASAPAIFQREMDKILRGQKGASCYLDDLLITGSSLEEHRCNLHGVLEKLQAAGAKLHPAKCEFMKTSVEYLGHRIDKLGLHPTESKLDAIVKAPAPTNVNELRSFIGLITYYAKFMPNMSTILSPLYLLLKSSQSWKWGKEESQAFKKAKEVLTSSSVLVHFDNNKEVVLACDASPYGIGAVLSHMTPQGDRPIAFASRSLSKSEKNYSHLEKEALALIFGVLRFRKYLLGRKFILLTDHQPLVSLFSESKPVPAVAAARIQRWALTLSAYSYEIKYRKGSSHGNADACSRLPMLTAPVEQPQPQEIVLLMKALDDTPITAHAIRKEIKDSPTLSKVRDFIVCGWPKSVENDLRPFWLCRKELSVEDNIILRGSRVYIPDKFRSYILNELHQGHQGMTVLKSMARSMVWWPNVDRDIEELVRSCSSCQLQAPMPPAEKSAWPLTDEVWDRIHIDHAGPFEGHTLLIVVDAGSKWLEVFPVRNTSASATISVLRSLFSRFGLPRTLVCDNGSGFTSSEFEAFLVRNGITQVITAPYHPQSNGLAERAVRTVKTALKKLTEGSLKDRLETFLYNYRKSPFGGNGASPATKMLGRPMRSRLDLLQPSFKSSECGNTKRKQVSRRVAVGNTVWVRNYGVGSKWIKGIVRSHLGKVMLRIQTASGLVRRHLDQVRPGLFEGPTFEYSSPEVAAIDLSQPTRPEEREEGHLADNSTEAPAAKDNKHEGPAPEADVLTSPTGQEEKPSPAPDLRRSQRNRRPPERLKM